MYVGPAQLIYSTAFGETKASKTEAAIYTTLSAALSGTFDPMATPTDCTYERPVQTQLGMSHTPWERHQQGLRLWSLR